MIAVLGGFGAALCFSVSTLSFSRANRHLAPAVVLGWVMLVGLAITVPLLLGFGVPATFTSADLVWLALVGIGNVGGLLLEFVAFRWGKVGIIATITSAEGAVTAVLAALAGEPVPAVLGLALAVTVIGVMLTTITPGEVESLEAASARRTVLLATAAAILFGVGLFSAGRVGTAVPVVWILLPARLLGTVGVAVPLAAARRFPLLRPAVPFVIASGISEVAGFVSFTLGARDSIAIAAVLASQFATITTIAAYALFGERLTRVQVSGIVLVVAGVAGITLARAA